MSLWRPSRRASAVFRRLVRLGGIRHSGCVRGPADGSRSAPSVGLAGARRGRLSAAVSATYPTWAVLKGAGLSEGDADPAAGFDLLYRRFRLPLYRFIRGMILEAEAAEELTLRAFERAYAARESFGGELSAASWLHGFALRLSLRHLRRRRLVALLTGRRPGPPGSEEDGDRTGVEVALAALSPALRAVALLDLYADLSIEEVAAVIGSSEGTASSRLRAAVQVMTATLASRRHPEAARPQ